MHNYDRRTKIAQEGPTAEEMVADLKRGLEPFFRDWMLRIEVEDNFGQQQTIHITYASVPKGSPELEALNAKQNVMLSIEGGRAWKVGGPAPDKVKVSKFRGNAKFRAKSGPPDKVVAYIVNWFKKNEKDLK